ncbi:MAG: hypothetical protein U0271_34155 [Polyangiaceae bacterium]
MKRVARDELTKDEAKLRASVELAASIGRALPPLQDLQALVAIDAGSLEVAVHEAEHGTGSWPAGVRLARPQGRPRDPRARLVSGLDVDAAQATFDWVRPERGFLGTRRRARLRELALASIWILGLDMGGAPRSWVEILSAEGKAIFDARRRHGLPKVERKMRALLAEIERSRGR